jgi:hypothetical protein
MFTPVEMTPRCKKARAKAPRKVQKQAGDLRSPPVCFSPILKIRLYTLGVGIAASTAMALIF